MDDNGNAGPGTRCREDVYWRAGPETEKAHPDKDIAPSSQQAKATVEGGQFIELLLKPGVPQSVEQVVE